ncbi:MAG TPA: M28 family peptidase [Blastocatellia bacterium]|nr:M28 family peptidase [Blastocatellia bacterium]
MHVPSGPKKTPFLLAAIVIALLIFVACKDQSAATTTPASSDPGIAKVTGIDAKRAYEDVKKYVSFGPHPAGSEANRKVQGFIELELNAIGLEFVEDKFIAETPHGKVPMMNIIAQLPGEKQDTVLISGHYDTAPVAGFVGANDGGSSTAAVLEMARVLARTKPAYTLWFVFFDGEEAVVDWSAMDGADNTYGSRHLAEKLADFSATRRVRAMVLVDMIGDKDLDIQRDNDSTPWMVDTIWDTARRIGSGKYFLGNETQMDDDHTPFRRAGVPVVDIIDFDYGPDNSYWHTVEDSLDKVSGESIKIVSDVVLNALPEIYKGLDSGAGETPRHP